MKKVYRRIGALLCVLALGPTATAQEATRVESRDSPAPAARAGDPAAERRDAEDRRLVELCSAADGELRADALLACVESGAIKGRAARAEACRSAFAVAASAQPAVSVHPAARWLDTSTGFLWEALQTFPVDRLSLESRAILGMLEVDPRRAVAMVAEVPPSLRVEPTGCAEGVLAAPGRFYAALAEVVDRGFSSTERARGAHLALAHEYVSGIRAPAQVVPAARFVLRIDVTDAERADLVRSYTDALAAVPGSDMAVVLSLRETDDRRAIVDLADGVADRPEVRRRLLEALRAWLLRSLRQPRCSEVFERDDKRVPRAVLELNERLFAGAPLTDDEVGRKGVERSPDVAYWTSPVARDLRDRISMLQHGMPPSLLAPEALDYQLRYDRLVDDVRAWKAADEASVSAYFEQRGTMYGSLYVAAIDAASRAVATSEFVTFMTHYEGREVRRAVWLRTVSLFLGIASQKEAKADVLEAFAASGSPTLEVYATLEALGAKALFR